jgi:hypothetical protein
LLFQWVSLLLICYCPFFYIVHIQIKIDTRIQNGTESGIKTTTVPLDVGMVLEVDDSRRHQRLNLKRTADLVKDFKISPLALEQNAVKATKISPCLPHQCLHPLSQPQSPHPPTFRQ